MGRTGAGHEPKDVHAVEGVRVQAIIREDLSAVRMAILIGKVLGEGEQLPKVIRERMAKPITIRIRGRMPHPHA